jgi:hypothetical protein
MADVAEPSWEDERRWLDEPPGTPRSVKVHFSRTDVDGRLEQTAINVPLPQHATVAMLLELLQEELGLSPRQPLEMRLWGAVLDTSRLFRDLSLKADSSGLALIMKRPPPIPSAALCAVPLTRLRIRSTKLQLPITIDGITGETVVGELKRMFAERNQRNKIYIAPEAKEADERTGGMALRKGDQLMLDGGGDGKKGTMKVRRVRDGETGNVTEADVMELKISEEVMVIFFEGEALADDKPLGKCGFINNDLAFCDFPLPWESAEDKGGGGGDKKGGGKKKK